MKRRQVLKLYKRLLIVLQIANYVMRTVIPIISTASLTIVVLCLYFLLGNEVPLLERVLCTCVVFILGPMSTYLWAVCGNLNLKSKELILLLKRSEFLSNWESRSVGALLPCRIYLGNYLYIKEAQVLLYLDSVANLTTSLILTYPSRNFFWGATQQLYRK
jgi:hypothetical protein